MRRLNTFSIVLGMALIIVTSYFYALRYGMDVERFVETIVLIIGVMLVTVAAIAPGTRVFRSILKKS
jgi:hypothetical protein